MKKLLFLILSITYCFGQEQGVNLYNIKFTTSPTWELSQYIITPSLSLHLKSRDSKYTQHVQLEDFMESIDSICIIQIKSQFNPKIYTARFGQKQKDWQSKPSNETYDFLTQETFKFLSLNRVKLGATKRLPFQQSSGDMFVLDFDFATSTQINTSPVEIWFMRYDDYNRFLQKFKNNTGYTTKSITTITESKQPIVLPQYTKLTCDSIRLTFEESYLNTYHITLTCLVDSLNTIITLPQDVTLSSLLTPSQYDSIQQSNQQKMIAETPKAEAQSKDSEEEEPVQPNEFGVTGPYKTMEEWDVAKNKYTPPMGHPYGVLFCGYSYLWTSIMIQMYMYDYMESSYSCNFEDSDEFSVKRSADKRYVVYSQTYSQRGVFMNNEHQNKITFEFYTKVTHGDPIIHHVRITGDIVPVAAFYANYWTHLKPGAMNPNAPYVFWGDKISPLSISSATKATFTINRSSNKLTEHAIDIF